MGAKLVPQFDRSAARRRNVHQVNLELLSQTVWSANDGKTGAEWAYPDTVIGTDSHTTMVNGLAVWDGA